MKIYRIVYTSIYIEEGEHIVNVKTFFDKEKAFQHYKEMLKDLKKQQEELDMEDYKVDEDEMSYERYLDGQSMEDSVSLWLEEDDTYDELKLEIKQKMQNEKDKDYEM